MSLSSIPQAILVFPHLRVQNANAISSPLTHGFPSITAFTGLMWALERQLAQSNIPLHLHQVGIICHQHQEQVAPGFVHTFHLTRNPIDKDGSTAAIVEEGRIHLDITLVFTVSENTPSSAVPTLVQGSEEAMQQWADAAGQILSQMRVAGGSLLPGRAAPGRRLRPWLAVLPDDAAQREQQWRHWRRQWLPGFALVARDDLLVERLAELQKQQPQATLLDAWLHASRFNYQPAQPEPDTSEKKVTWADPQRGPGSGWIVPIPVGYAALSERHPPGVVANARDARVPVRFVEAVYSLGEWLSPHRLTHLEQLLWQAHTDEAQGLYRCRNAYKSPDAALSDAEDSDDDDYPY
ncbi:MAG: type I-F CRISPR-associated protein Csy2 [Giesbergeria sp.]|uniref:type I-F CRISPR-associated protein Csy2 n=1 Tax=Giesbergeria sp. TaxID=2818473 RepID=UPI00263A1AFE|nr:type I-F CRISPR-associated protein Csy2 [Giesbergeria sp.]MDD2608455.1 type I-F CRISPR-associated protein Csy2 [Giesbergeria sp.]